MKRPRWICTLLLLLALYEVVFVLLLAHSCRGQSQGFGPSPTIVTVVGEDVILPCRLDPALDAVSKTVEWGRPDLEPRFVHVWDEGKNLLVKQNPSYTGRTSVSVEKLKHGDLSLKLSAVKHSDNGRYRCYFPSLDKQSTVELVVGSVSTPVMSNIHLDSSGVVVECKSEGWYPEPEVLWLDGEGNLLSAGPAETVRGPDDLYTVSSRVTVEKRHSNRFTCRVQQKDINQTREAHIQLSGFSRPLRSSHDAEERYEKQSAADMFSPPSSSTYCIIVGLVSGIAGSLITVGVLLIFWKCNETTIMHYIFPSKTKSLAERQSQLRKESVKVKEQLDALRLVLTLCMDMKGGLGNQRQEFRQQLEDISKEREENKERVNLVEMKIKESEKENAADKTEGYLREQQNLLNAQHQLEKKKEGLEKQQLNIEKLLQKTEDMMTTIRERKQKAESHIELIQLHLEERESQDDRARLHRE